MTFFVGDVFAIAAFGPLASAFGWTLGISPQTTFYGQGAIVSFAIFIFVLVGQVFNVYDTRRILERRHSLRCLTMALCLTFGTLLVVGVATKSSQSYSRLWFFSWAAATCIATPAWRLAALALMRRKLAKGAFVYRAISASIFCQPLHPRDISRISENHVRTDYILRLRNFAQLEELADIIAADEVDQIYLATPWVDAPALLQQLQSLRRFSAEIFVLPEDDRVRMHQLGGATMGDRLSLKAVDRAIDDWGLWFKRAQDIGVALGMLALFAPVLAAVALAIKFETPGPLLFRQRRVGFNGRVFELLKFRSMREDASDADASRQTARGDERVTRVGRFIRRTSLDELPQFINVLRGDMSVVGPRPHALKTRAEGHDLADVTDNYAARHRMKPGLTGWAQVNGLRGELDTIEKLQKRVEHDIEYIENWSTWFDARIIFRTATLLLNDGAAY